MKKKHTEWISLGIWIIFEAIAVILWLTKNNLFYLLNFSYIGTSIALGLVLFRFHCSYARRVVQLLVGLYMLIYLGILCRENMQIEDFWYYLFSGAFEAATIHYAVAKLFGPLLFGKGWCGYACWTAMVLDFLPYKIPQGPRKKLGFLRYLTFAASLLFVAALFLSHAKNLEKIMFWAFLIGNVLYYSVGILLAFLLRDNRAFCKYICPITVFLKPMSYFSLLRIKCDQAKCISCGKCKRVAPWRSISQIPQEAEKTERNAFSVWNVSRPVPKKRFDPVSSPIKTGRFRFGKACLLLFWQAFLFYLLFLCRETSEQKIFRRVYSFCLNFSLPGLLSSGFRFALDQHPGVSNFVENKKRLFGAPSVRKVPQGFVSQIYIVVFEAV